jgi:hypothetical protein
MGLAIINSTCRRRNFTSNQALGGAGGAGGEGTIAGEGGDGGVGGDGKGGAVVSRRGKRDGVAYDFYEQLGDRRRRRNWRRPERPKAGTGGRGRRRIRRSVLSNHRQLEL